MSGSGSYKLSDISVNPQLELERLKAQVELFWDKEVKHYIEYGLIDGMSLLECGSGPGFLTEKLLDCFPDCFVTAVEIDEYLCRTAGDYLREKQLSRYRIVNRSILDTGLEAGSFDFAVTRLLIEHLPRPVAALKEIFRLLKPGGRAVFIDNDFDLHIRCYPHIAGLRNLYDAYCRARTAQGGDPLIGRQLPCLLKQAGFAEIDFEIITAHNFHVADEAFFKSEGMGIPLKLVQDGFLDSKVLAEISMAWRKVIKNPQHVLLRQLVMAVGTKNNNPGEVK